MLDCPIIGVARDEWSAATLREHARQAIEDSGETVDEDVFQRLAERLSMVSGDYTDPKTYDRLAQAIEGRHVPVFYLEIPPSLFGRVVEGLAGAGLTGQRQGGGGEAFGHDLASARALNAELRKLLEEWQILRIDHFLGKEPAMDILFLRFANSIFEPLWNRDRIAVRADHHGRGLRRRGPGQLLRPGRGAPRRRAEPSAAAHRPVRLRAARPWRCRRAAGQAGRGVQGHARGRPEALRPRASTTGTCRCRA